MINYKYLDKLVDKTNLICDKIKFCEIDTADCIITYMATKKTSFLGFKQGYCDILQRSHKGIKESDKISPKAKNFLKFIKNKNGELIQVESYVDREIDCLFQVHWIENVRYLFPFSSNGGYYPTYTYVTKYQSNCVSEEYMVLRSQIIYESYAYKSKEEIEYHFIDYVSGGKVPVLTEKKGVLYTNPLAYEEKQLPPCSEK